jgi:predicted transcriptional regulator
MATGKSRAEQLLELLKQPKSSQQLFDRMDCPPTEVEDSLYELRDEGVIAYANSQWYVVDSSRLVRVQGPKPGDERQRKLFE